VKTNRYSRRHDALIALLAAIRKEAGLCQTEVARRLGRPQSFVSKYESGQRRLDLPELEEICQALGLSLCQFIERYSRT
jgi:transcriptional regulator with XRE-family HTH domain